MHRRRPTDRPEASLRCRIAPGVLLAVLLTAASALATDAAPTRRSLTLFGVDAGAPQQLAVSMVLVAAFRGEPLRLERHSLDGSGLAVRLQPGLTGGEIGVGILSMTGAVGFSAEAVALRTWGGDPWLAEPDTTYAGVAASLYGYGLHLRLGPLYGIGGDDSGGWAVAVSVGLGF